MISKSNPSIATAADAEAEQLQQLLDAAHLSVTRAFTDYDAERDLGAPDHVLDRLFDEDVRPVLSRVRAVVVPAFGGRPDGELSTLLTAMLRGSTPPTVKQVRAVVAREQVSAR